MLKKARNATSDNVFKYQTKKSGCGNCPINCGGTVSVKDGPYAVEGVITPDTYRVARDESSTILSAEVADCWQYM